MIKNFETNSLNSIRMKLNGGLSYESQEKREKDVLVGPKKAVFYC